MIVTQSLDLRTLRARAVRKGHWYRVLDRVERGIVNLSIELVERVKSLTLSQVINIIVDKLRIASQSPFLRHVESYGRKKAKEIVSQAKCFGSECADAWLLDSGFHQWLSLHDMYGRYTGYKVNV